MDLSGADADSDGYYGTAFYGTDCNDTNASINPGAAELCNSLDDNCDGKIDEGAQTTFYKDSDGDGDGQAGATALACSVPSGYAANSGDCNDANAAINPGAKEACNSIDDNCDGTIDEGAQTTFYKDGDGDGYGQTGTTTLACIVPSGYAAKSGDCNAADTAVYPGALEACDSKDNNCDGLTDEGVQTTFYRDADGDGYGVGTVTRLACTAPTGYASESGDCDDSDPAAFPDATETCNGKDDNCNGAIDDNAKTTFYADSDGDGYGDSVRPADACAAPTGYVTDNSDCNDADRNTHPGALEVCDGRDNNCDATIDEGVQTTYYQDADGDTYGNAAVTKSGCERPVGYAASSADCDDTSASIHPGATESCNSIDDNCDGQTDDGVKTRFYADTDDDGYGDDQNTIDSCSRLQGYVSVGGDCNDQASAIYPGAPETCDGLDEDCDGQIDEDVQTTFYADSDGDNYGDPQNAMQGCQPPEGYLDSDTDCNDTAPDIHPGASDVCGDGIDQDCNSYDLGCDQADQDGDGVSQAQGDCNDADPQTYPNAPEACDGKDNDCNGQIDDLDADADGSIALACGGSDCDDADAGVFPGAEEQCDGIDNDCNGKVDDRDIDLDGYVDVACSGDDCNDTDPQVNPGADEVCDGRDNDCDGTADNLDEDGDGETASSCGGTDCDDSDADVYPGASETEDGQDNDCNGQIDEGSDAYDDDGDGFSENTGDCDDADASSYPGTDELPDDGKDNNCDGQIDEGDTSPTPVESSPTPAPYGSPTPGPDGEPTPTPAPGDASPTPGGDGSTGDGGGGCTCNAADATGPGTAGAMVMFLLTGLVYRRRNRR